MDQNYSFADPIFGIPIVLNMWKVIGLTGAVMFGSRWIVQFYYSRKAGMPVTPRIFWVMSIIGSLMTLSYFLFGPKRDMVGIVQNILPSMIAGYNLYLDLTHKQRMSAAAAAKGDTKPGTELETRPRPERKDSSRTAPLPTPLEAGEAAAGGQ